MSELRSTGQIVVRGILPNPQTGRSPYVSSLVFIDILALFRQYSPRTHASQAAADPEVWGLRCPEGTGRGERCNLPELRLRRISDVPKQRLRHHTTS